MRLTIIRERTRRSFYEVSFNTASSYAQGASGNSTQTKEINYRSLLFGHMNAVSILAFDNHINLMANAKRAVTV